MSKKSSKVLLIMFLLGIFMGSLDTAIISPARTIMGNTLHISADASIWIITLYSLIYAVSMPISGKLADKFGLKTMFTVSILLFGVGSFLCGISNFYGSFHFLLISRAIEAIGGGGVIPIATAYIGMSFPPEKRGMALGMVGGINGIATLIGPSLGSFILDTFGGTHWDLLFFINIPICIMVFIVLLATKVEKFESPKKKLDITGSVVSGLFIVTLMLFITNLNFVNLKASFLSTKCFPYLIAAVVLFPILLFVESRAEDPVINLKYFKKRSLVSVFIIAFLVGAGLMVVVFLPQFCSNVLRLKLGSGGYFVTLMALFSGFAAPFGGKLIDKFSPKLVLIFGFISTIIGTLLLALVVTATLNTVPLVIGLAFMGLGVGFTMGTPLNYVIQSSVPKEEIGSAQSTLSLIRSLGVALSPNLLVGFISAAGSNVGTNLMGILPKVPGAGAMTSGLHSSAMVNAFQNANVTTIFETVKNFVSNQFNAIAPKLAESLRGVPLHERTNTIVNMKMNYMTSIDRLRLTIESTYQKTMNAGFSKMFLTLTIIAVIAFIIALTLPKKISSTEE
ncbi:MFS transporter [uncultured Clostridium sp.]|uniref:MFS transporter n=1 Tax=uncultured Clostridium sp. TaxID=59620 RepID=UPI0026257A82|nr:MFS transporter [uncultured Clostridium sp.]